MAERPGDQRLDWDDIHAIARALNRQYPDTDRLSLDAAALTALITGLPGFAGASQPDNLDRLQHIRLAWIAASEPADEDGRYDYFQ